VPFHWSAALPMQLPLNEWAAGSPLPVSLLGLLDEEIQLWMACVPANDEGLAKLSHCLIPDERARAGRFSHHDARREFVFARIFLRKLLGECLQVNPATLEFEIQAQGKPCLRASGANRELRFNLSHSGERVVIALARGREVGVDIEWIHGLEDWQGISDRIFSPRELAELHALPRSQQRQACFNGWTRKEAWLKATGEGLTDALPAIEVTLAPDRPPEWLGLPGGRDAMQRWSVRDIALPEGFAGAVVYENT